MTDVTGPWFAGFPVPDGMDLGRAVRSGAPWPTWHVLVPDDGDWRLLCNSRAATTELSVGQHPGRNCPACRTVLNLYYREI